MSVATLNKKDFGISQMAKKFNFTAGAGKSISALKTVIQLTTSKQTTKHSQDILNNVSVFAKDLSELSNKIKVSDLKKYSEQTNNNIQFVNTILFDINNVIDGGGKFKIDDDNMKSFINNFKAVQKKLEYISDYLNLTIEIQSAKKEIAAGKGIHYTLDELLVKLNPAA